MAFWSRWWLSLRDEDQDDFEDDIVALVPYIDLINHNPNSESRIRGVGATDRMTSFMTSPSPVHYETPH